MKWRGLALLAMFTLTILTGISCSSAAAPKSFTLKYWTVAADPEALNTAIKKFQASYPYINITVSTFTPEEYESKLIEGWSHDEGPDIFSVANTNLGKFKTYIKPLPATITLKSVTEKKSFAKTQTIVTNNTITTVSPQKLNSLFPQVVYNNVVLTDNSADSKDKNTLKIFGLPLNLDTLVLYYNKELLSRAAIPLPATNWTDFTNQVSAPKLTLIDINNNIVQSGVALGTCSNVPLCFDIISLIMMQNNATMVKDNRIMFNRSTDQAEYPGVKALEFYTSFAQVNADGLHANNYSWDTDQPAALEAFMSGNSAYYFGYHYQLEQIRNKAPNLNFDITTVPQINATAPVNYASYWVETVANNSAHPNEAWGFIEQLTTNETNVKTYLDTTKQPAALNSLLQTQQEDYTLGIFANAILTANSWYAGQAFASAKAIFKDMVEQINQNKLDVTAALNDAADKIELTYQTNEK
ncbi:MAG: extracellular solute-binding protein [Patescibacteria group bacterium]